MMDPRGKKPQSQDLNDRSHEAWLISKGAGMNGTSVIPRKIRKDKTATVLSEREIEVLYFFSIGMNTVEVADKLFLSHHTVTNHRRNMLERSQCKTLPELVRLAMSEKLI